jgi:hypothetical protein
MPVQIISNEIDSIQYALDNAKPGSFNVILADDVMKTIQYIKNAQNKSGIIDTDTPLQDNLNTDPVTVPVNK